nr:CPBP family intramembrane glutamic endopeptidase [Amycolatopsis granulosa]
MLGWSLSREPGSPQFFAATGATAAIWIAGGLTRPPDPGGPVLAPVATGLGAFAVFRAGVALAHRVPPLRRALRRALRGVLGYATAGHRGAVLLTTLANGVGEEVFFRGAVQQTVGPAGSTALYVLVTAATRNPALVAASAVMGALFAWQRHASGGVRAPLLTHLVWSALMVWRLPTLVPREPDP